MKRSNRRKNKKEKTKRRYKKNDKTKRKYNKKLKGGSDGLSPPEGIVHKKKPTLRTWPRRYIKIEGKSLNVYELDSNLEIKGLPRGSSISDLTGVSVNVDEESFLNGLSFVKYPKLIISGGNIRESVEIAFLSGTQTIKGKDITGENLKDSFKEAIENISAGRKWNISQGAATVAATKIQSRRRGINARKTRELETKRRLKETGTMKQSNQRDYLQSQEEFSERKEGSMVYLTPTPEFLTDLQPCSFDYSVQQCGRTCWFTSVTTFLVKNKNIRLLLGNNKERVSMHELSTWLAKLHGLHHGDIITLLGSEQKCTLQTQGMCFDLPDSVKGLMLLNRKIHLMAERFFDYKTLNDYWHKNSIQRIDTSVVDSDDGLFSRGGHSVITIASMLNGLLFHKFKDGTYCVNIDLLSLPSNSSYGEPLSAKIKESMSDRALSMLILTNTANDGCALKMFDYLKNIFKTSRLLDSEIIIAGGGVNVLPYEEKEILIEKSHFRANDKPVNGTNKIPMWGQGHAISFKVCNGKEGVKINVSDTGIGIDYFVWWKLIDRELVMQTSGISEKYLDAHHKYYLGMSDSCYNDYPEAGQLSYPDRWNYNLYREARELEWLPISLSKRFPQTVEAKKANSLYIRGLNRMSEIMLTHCLGMHDSQFLILMNNSKLGEQQYFTDDEMPPLMQPFLPSYMDVISKNETERETIRKEVKYIKSLINMEFEEKQRNREYEMSVETPEERKQRERMEWYTRGNDELKAKSEKDKKSWEILRKQPWLYGRRKDKSFPEQALVSGI